MDARSLDAPAVTSEEATDEAEPAADAPAQESVQEEPATSPTGLSPAQVLELQKLAKVAGVQWLTIEERFRGPIGAGFEVEGKNGQQVEAMVVAVIRELADASRKARR